MDIKDEIKDLDRKIAYWKSTISEAERIIEAYQTARDTLARKLPDKEPVRHPQRRKEDPFTTKYGKSSKQLALELLRDKSNKRLTASEIQKTLASQGKSFTPQAVAAGLDELAKAEKIKKVPAPKESRSKWVYYYMES